MEPSSTSCGVVRMGTDVPSSARRVRVWILNLKIGIFALFVAVMRSVAWVFADESDPPPEAHPAEKSRTDEAIHTAVSTRLQDSDINFPVEQTSALCSRVIRVTVYFLRKNIRLITLRLFS
jgi:flagellar basal body-associated protein FliL